MTLLAICFLGVVLRLIGLHIEVYHLHRQMDMRDRYWLARFTGEEREAERKFVNILRRARGVPPL